jgi:hypothetical protein
MITSPQIATPNQRQQSIGVSRSQRPLWRSLLTLYLFFLQISFPQWLNYLEANVLVPGSSRTPQNPRKRDLAHAERNGLLV